MKADWIAVDWGLTKLRVWAMRDLTVLAEMSSDHGASGLAPKEFEAAVLAMIEDWIDGDPVDIVVCGAVADWQGGESTPLVAVPAPPIPSPLLTLTGTDPRMNVSFIPGLKQGRPADIMQGEETRIAGFLAMNENWDGVICLPGTQTKWVHVSANEVVSFQTFLTGEMFDLLSGSSVLCQSIGEGWNEDAFGAALEETLSRPESLAAKLFEIRAKDVLEGQAGSDARARLSGLLIGAELAATRPYWLGQQIAVIGEDAVVQSYARAIERQGAPVTVHEDRMMALAGLTSARKQMVSAA